MILALLAGAILAKLFLRHQPLQLIQVSMYNLAEWLWRFVYYFLVCVTGPTEHDEALWDPSWRPTVTPDNWQNDHKAVPDQYPEIERAIPSGPFHRSDRKMPNVIVPKDDSATSDSDEAVQLVRHKISDGRCVFKFPQVVGHLESSSDDDDMPAPKPSTPKSCLLYTSDAADE